MSFHNKQYDYVFKLILIGDSGVGKTNILNRYVNNTSNENNMPTIGIEFFIKTIKINNDVLIKNQIWDTSGQERFRSITSAYYRNSDGCIIVYDISKRESFNNIKFWFEDLSKYLDIKKICFLLIGNKSDLYKLRQVSYEEGMNIAKKYNADFIETSAFDDFSKIHEGFYKIMEYIYKKKNSLNEINYNPGCNLHSNVNSNGINLKCSLNSNDSIKKKGCNC